MGDLESGSLLVQITQVVAFRPQLSSALTSNDDGQ